MVADAGFWNTRRDLTSLDTGEYVCKEHVDTGFVTDTVKNLDAFLHNKRSQLWSEVAIIKAVLYKHHNQHRKEKYFQVLKKIIKCLKRLEEIGLHQKISKVMDKFPRLSKLETLKDETISICLSVGMVVNILGCFTGAAKLMAQVMLLCKEAYQVCCAHMENGVFLTFHLTCVASVSRLWVLLKDYMTDTAECYEVMFPWLQLLGCSKMVYSRSEDLPKSLKTLLEPEKTTGIEEPSRNSLPLSYTTNSNSRGLLDKLFASTPREKPRDEPPSLPEPACDLGESYIPVQEKCQRYETTEDDVGGFQLVNLKRKLVDICEVWKENEVGCQLKLKRNTEGKKQNNFKLVVSKKSRCKHKRTGFDRHKFCGQKRASTRLGACGIIHVFSDKRWNNYKDGLWLKKSLKNQRCNKSRNVATSVGNSLNYKEARNSKDCTSGAKLICKRMDTPNKGNFPEEKHSSDKSFIQRQMALLCQAPSTDKTVNAERKDFSQPDNEIDDIFSILDD